jgi:hypothetical protein
VNTVIVYCGFFGEKITICDSGTALIMAARAFVRRSSVRFARVLMS